MVKSGLIKRKRISLFGTPRAAVLPLAARLTQKPNAHINTNAKYKSLMKLISTLTLGCTAEL